MGTLDLTERFAILRRKEEEVYHCPDYLSPEFRLRQKAQPKSQVYSLASDFRSYSSTTSSTSQSINEVWREKICEWIFQVVDYLNFNREVAFVSLNYLDRYLSICSVNGENLQLAALTSFFLAVKLYNPTTLAISSLIQLSRGHFNDKHIVFMENSILWSLTWNVHPPTPLCFVRHFISLLEESSCPSDVTLEIEELARFLTEISVCDYYFTTRKASLIGLGALLTAFDSIDESTLPLRVRHSFLIRVRSIAGIDPSSKEVQECKDRLDKTYFLDYRQQNKELSGVTIDGGHVSPVCVVNVDETNLSNV